MVVPAKQYLMNVREEIRAEAPYFFVKMLDKKWVNKFSDGDVFVRTLAYFGDLKKQDSKNRNAFGGDTLEGISESFAGGYDCYSYAQDGSGIIKDGTLGIIDALTLHKKVFCLYSLEYDIENKCFLKPDSELRDFGDTAVIITDAKEFLRRVQVALTEKYGDAFWWSYKRGSYDVDLYGGFKYNEFCKSWEYSWQNEFRIVLDLSGGKFSAEILDNVTDFAKLTFTGRLEEDKNPDSISDSLILEIGDIRDICVEMPVNYLLTFEQDLFECGVAPQKIDVLDVPQKLRPAFCRRISAIPRRGNRYYLSLA